MHIFCQIHAFLHPNKGHISGQKCHCKLVCLHVIYIIAVQKHNSSAMTLRHIPNLPAVTLIHKSLYYRCSRFKFSKSDHSRIWSYLHLQIWSEQDFGENYYTYLTTVPKVVQESSRVSPTIQGATQPHFKPCITSGFYNPSQTTKVPTRYAAVRQVAEHLRQRDSKVGTSLQSARATGT